eukprot:CAMPEP_0182446652 /NCGR_PEP_ID=MMETSP1172-20130603/4326_1 /TAXON_ID=708627 /ORGANISM="Timspurckia oligopyrenoides, Strain CCMP3278" /LENGTH=609 /DNA_ID=CAMNT_0024642605 /DNA_START=69 /DNA_END=1898 /DNA_ORIENTATION=-
MESFVNSFALQVLSIPVLRNFLEHGIVDSRYGCDTEDNSEKNGAFSMELSIPVISQAQMCRLYRATSERAKEHGFYVINPLDSDRTNAPAVNSLEKQACFNSVMAKSREMYGADDAHSELSLCSKGTTTERGLVDTGNQMNISDDEIHSKSISESFYHLPLMRLGYWVAGNVYDSGSCVRFVPLFKQGQVNEAKVVSSRFVGNLKTGQKFEYVSLDDGTSLLLLVIIGVDAPLLLEFMLFKGSPFNSLSEKTETAINLDACINRCRLINMSDCESCKTEDCDLCECSRSALFRGLTKGRFQSDSHPGEFELFGSLSNLIADRIQDSASAHPAFVASCIGPKPEEPLKWAFGSKRTHLTSNWFRAQLLSPRGVLQSEMYEMISCSIASVERRALDLFRILFPNKSLDHLGSPVSDLRLLPAGDELQNSKAVRLSVSLDLEEDSSSSGSQIEMGSRRMSRSRKIFDCLTCGKQFPSRFNLKRHEMSMHSNERPFECEICLSSFKVKDHLTQHVKVAHNTDKLQLFKCHLCIRETTFRTKSNLIRHVKETHENLRPFECPKCPKKFRSKFSLSRHLASNLHGNNPTTSQHPTQAYSSDDQMEIQDTFIDSRA